jgi:hypothetical protein
MCNKALVVPLKGFGKEVVSPFQFFAPDKTLNFATGITTLIIILLYLSPLFVSQHVAHLGLALMFQGYEASLTRGLARLSMYSISYRITSILLGVTRCEKLWKQRV